METLENMNKALIYIEENLADDIDFKKWQECALF
jgi:hypothetical protein